MKQITFDITLLEPLLVNSVGNDPNTSTTLTYIPGMAIRGALAAKYGRVANLAKEPQFVRFFLSGIYRYGNGYLVAQEQRVWPAPKCWIKLKDREDSPIYNLLNSKAKEETKGKQSKGFGDAFVVRDAEQCIHTKKPRYEIAVHNARNRKMGRSVPNDGDSALFRYQALAQGQTFRAGILCPADATTTELTQLQEWLQGDIFLGTSSSAGYGHCRVSAATVDDVAEPSTAPSTHFTLYLASHAIVRHPDTGQTGPYLLEWLKVPFPNHTFTLQTAHSRLVQVGGFNTTWGLPLPQSWAIEMGSVWQITAKPDLTAAELKQLAQGGIGERRAEGFGQVVLNPDWHDQKTLAVPDEKKGTKQKRPQPAKVHITHTKAPDGEAKRVLVEMEKRLVTSELDLLLLVCVAQLPQDNAKSVLGNSQIGRLRLQIRHVLNHPTHDFGTFITYLEGTEKRRVVNNKFRKSRLGKENLRDWLLQLAKIPSTAWTLLGLPSAENWTIANDQWQRPLLQAEPFVLDDMMSRRYAAQLIAAVCERLARQTGGDR